MIPFVERSTRRNNILILLLLLELYNDRSKRKPRINTTLIRLVAFLGLLEGFVNETEAAETRRSKQIDALNKKYTCAGTRLEIEGRGQYNASQFTRENKLHSTVFFLTLFLPQS